MGIAFAFSKEEFLLPCFTPSKPHVSELASPSSFSFSDSKTLTEAQREQLFEQLNAAKDYVGWALHILSPNFISTSMQQR